MLCVQRKLSRGGDSNDSHSESSSYHSGCSTASIATKNVQHTDYQRVGIKLEDLEPSRLTGIWKENGNENTRYVLSDDFSNGKIVGFMQYKGISKSTFNGHKTSGNTFDVVETIHDTQQRMRYLLTLYPKEQRLELRGHGDPIGMRPLTLYLVDHHVSTSLSQELKRNVF